MRLLNSLSGQKEEVLYSQKNPLHFFVCGPTVFDYSHIGHARTYIAFDVFARFIRSKKWKMVYLQNITDVDDKIIDRARMHDENPLRYAWKFESLYKNDMKAIGCISVNRYARATDHIKEIENQIQTLITKGNAYYISGQGYYFDITTFKEYGKLSRRTITQAEDAVTRIDEQIEKRNKGDFALWKEVKVEEKDKKKKFVIVNGEPAWNTKLGWGRPGWHIEDTAITERWFGPQYDIHGGGGDLKFPHHEAEIAQQESASGKIPFVKIWLHTGSLRINGEKMSKSLGNFFTIKDFLHIHSKNILRFIITSHHYRSPIQWSDSLITQAYTAIDTFTSLLDALSFIENKKIKINKETDKSVKNIEDILKKEFEEAMNDDLNTPEAIAALFKYTNSIRSITWKLSPATARRAKKTIKTSLKILGIEIEEEKIPSSITKIVEKRELCRSNKQFTPADTLRKQIDTLGYSIEDTPIGPFVRKKVCIKL
ncbi:MAG: cysteinyl-tRNA synthetase [Parcubacteria group bacterium LiPW_41]|nr:MAG: cysteinyl-tRNA synthetase [Parcubacteria group bacterium LiPW_41]